MILKNSVLIIVLLLIMGCATVRAMPPHIFPNGIEVTYIFSDYNHFLCGNSMSTLDRWKYDPKTGAVTLERADSTSSSSKVSDLIKNLPMPLPLP